MKQLHLSSWESKGTPPMPPPPQEIRPYCGLIKGQWWLIIPLDSHDFNPWESGVATGQPLSL